MSEKFPLQSVEVLIRLDDNKPVSMATFVADAATWDGLLEIADTLKRLADSITDVRAGLDGELA